MPKKKELTKDKSTGRASLCINCGACIPKCPQQIDIPTELSKVAVVLERHKKLTKVYSE